MKQLKNWSISDGAIMAAGSKVVYSDNQESVTLTGMVHYKLTNPTMLQHRKIAEIDVFIGSVKPEGGRDIVVTQLRAGSLKTIPYGHLPKAMIDMLQMDATNEKPTAKAKFEQAVVVPKTVKAKETKKAKDTKAKPPVTKKAKGGKPSVKAKSKNVKNIVAANPEAGTKVADKVEEQTAPVTEKVVSKKDLK